MSPSITPILILPFSSLIVLARIVVLPEPGYDIIFRHNFFCRARNRLFLRAYSSLALSIFLPIFFFCIFNQFQIRDHSREECRVCGHCEAFGPKQSQAFAAERLPRSALPHSQ
jgi:hypothetical protein